VAKLKLGWSGASAVIGIRLNLVLWMRRLIVDREDGSSWLSWFSMHSPCVFGQPESLGPEEDAERSIAKNAN
jgi:hypothetical protein